MTGRVGTVTDTTGFRVDGLVVIDNDTTADNWNVTRIRAIVTNTSIEFLHKLDGFGATANVRMIDAWRRFVPRARRKVGSEWQLWGVAFGQYLDDSANFDAFWECTLLLKHSGAGGPGSGTWAVDDLYTPGITVDDFGFDRSAENITFVTLPVLRGIPDKNIIKRNFEHPVLPGTMEMAGGL